MYISTLIILLLLLRKARAAWLENGGCLYHQRGRHQCLLHYELPSSCATTVQSGARCLGACSRLCAFSQRSRAPALMPPRTTSDSAVRSPSARVNNGQGLPPVPVHNRCPLSASATPTSSESPSKTEVQHAHPCVLQTHLPQGVLSASPAMTPILAPADEFALSRESAARQRRADISCQFTLIRHGSKLLNFQLFCSSLNRLR